MTKASICDPSDMTEAIMTFWPGEEVGFQAREVVETRVPAGSTFFSVRAGRAKLGIS